MHSLHIASAGAYHVSNRAAPIPNFTDTSSTSTDT